MVYFFFFFLNVYLCHVLLSDCHFASFLSSTIMSDWSVIISESVLIQHQVVLPGCEVVRGQLRPPVGSWIQQHRSTRRLAFVAAWCSDCACVPDGAATERKESMSTEHHCERNKTALSCISVINATFEDV